MKLYSYYGGEGRTMKLYSYYGGESRSMKLHAYDGEGRAAEHDTAGHLMSSARNGHSAPLLAFRWSETPTHGRVLPMLRMGLSQPII